MKDILYEIANALAFALLIAAIIFLWVGVQDSDIIALKAQLS